MIKLNPDFYYASNEDQVKLISLEGDDEGIYTLSKASARLFLILVNDSNETELDLKSKLSISNEAFEKFKARLVSTLCDHKILIS